jgi:DNA-binding MurR/RpiR family transcriptional regulator
MIKRNSKPIDERIEALSEALPDSERKLADLLTAQPALLATYSATELASMAGSSKAAVTRFIQRVGYATYSDARREAREAQRWGAPTFQLATSLSHASEESFGEHLRRDMENLAATFEKLTSGVVEPAISALARARRVAVVGYRNSHALAQYLARQLVLFKDGVHLLPQAGQTLGEDLSWLTPDDIVIVLAFRRRVPILSRILRHAQRSSIPTLVLTDAATPARELDATWRIVCETRGSAQFDSYAAPMSVLNLLVSMLALRPEISTTSRLRSSEKLHESLEEL